jgi:rhodanese-related sulfurtransferase
MKLTEEKVKSILPEEAMRMVTAGEAVLVDVRKPEDYEQSHAQDSVSVPLFRAVNPLKTDLKGMLKFAVYAVNGVGAVEANPDFEDEVAAVSGDKAAIFYCEAGGMLEPTPNFMYGRESRSLKAAYKVRSPPGTEYYHRIAFQHRRCYALCLLTCPCLGLCPKGSCRRTR